MPSSIDYKFKDILRGKISEAIEEITEGDNDFGWISDGIEVTMTEAAYLILEHNRELNNWLKKQDYLKDQI